MKLVISLFALLTSLPGLASTPAFEKLICLSVIGPTLHVEADDSTVKATVRSENNSQAKTYSFDTASCDFASGFSVDVTCENASHRLQISRQQVNSPQGSAYSELTIVIDDIFANKRQVEKFSTRRVQSGKVAQCFINDTFEIR